MSTYSLAEDVFYCFADCHCVVLDLKQDRYISIDRAKVEGLSPWLHALEDSTDTPMPPTTAETIEELVSEGILVRQSKLSRRIEPFSMQPATDSIVPAGDIAPRTCLLRLAPFLLSTRDAQRRLTRNPLESTVRFVRNRAIQGRRRNPWDSARAQHLIGVFEALRPLFPRNYLCLFDALALANFLARYGLFPQWVFGVQVEPFAAHCWLQEGHVVLNDTVDRVGLYTPIMAI